MAKRIQFRRGTTSEHTSFVGAPGEITIDTTKQTVVVHDGVRPGGYPITNRLDTLGATAFNGQVRITVDTPSSSTTTGSMSTRGGIGIEGSLFVGGNSRFTSTTNSTGVGSGALTVAGGVGIAGNLFVASLVESSSISLKENVNPITDALTYITQLAGVTYDRKDKSSIKEAGLIAEDVDKILPNLVIKDEQGKPNGIQYTKVVAYLIEAIKEQQQQIEELKKKV